MTVEDEIALLAEDIKRWAGQDARIHEALEQLIKLYEAEVNALAFEAIELNRLLVTSTTARENQRIADSQHGVHVVWAKPYESEYADGDWRSHGIA